jgi:hypothetical protein
MTTIACLRCDRLVEVVAIDRHDGSEIDLDAEGTGGYTVEAKSPTALITAICDECLPQDTPLFRKALKARLAKAINDGEDAIADMRMVIERVPAMRDDPRVQASFKTMEAQVEQFRTQLAVLLEVEAPRPAGAPRPVPRRPRTGLIAEAQDRALRERRPDMTLVRAVTGPSRITEGEASYVRYVLSEQRRPSEFRSGAADGVDTVAAHCALGLWTRCRHVLFVPAAPHNVWLVEDWTGDRVFCEEGLTRAESYRIRNTSMVMGVDELVAFVKRPTWYRSGEWMTIGLAERMGVEVIKRVLAEGNPNWP